MTNGPRSTVYPIARTPSNELTRPAADCPSLAVFLTRIAPGRKAGVHGNRHADRYPTSGTSVGVRCRVKSDDTRSMPGRCSSIRPGPQPGRAGAVGTAGRRRSHRRVSPITACTERYPEGTKLAAPALLIQASRGLAAESISLDAGTTLGCLLYTS